MDDQESDTEIEPDGDGCYKQTVKEANPTKELELDPNKVMMSHNVYLIIFLVIGYVRN